MKIAHIIYQIAAPGGMLSYMSRISEAMARDGHETQIWSFHIGNLAIPGVKLAEIHSASELEELVKAYKPDLINIHDLMEAPYMKALDGLPLVRTLHNNDMYCPSGLKFFRISGKPCNHKFSYLPCLLNHYLQGCSSRRPWLIFLLYKRLIKEWRTFKNTPIITFSNFQRDRLIEHGYKSELVFVNHVLGPDPAALGDALLPAKREGLYFLFLGRVVPEKGLDWLLKSLASSRLSYRLLIAGDGYDMPRLKGMVENLGLNGRVVFLGWVGQEEARRLLKNALAFVMPSLWHEAAGSSAAEALMMGAPMIISRVGGLQEFFSDGEAGFVVEPGDVEGLARAMDSLAENEGLAAVFGQSARDIALRFFCLERHMAKLYRIYNHVIHSQYCNS